MRFTPRQIVTMVMALSTALIFGPVGVMAATGSLTNITDPVFGSRRARVAAAGTLQVESRPGVPGAAFNGAWTADTLESFKVSETTGPQRIAITDISLGSVGPSNGTTTGHHYIDVLSYAQNADTSAGCGVTSSGYTVTTLRRLVVRNFEPTIQLNWNGPPMMSPTVDAGRKICVILRVNTFTTGSVIYLGASGYRFT